MYCDNCLLHNITGILSYSMERKKKIIKSSIDQILKIQRRSFHFEFLARRRKKSSYLDKNATFTSLRTYLATKKHLHNYNMLNFPLQSKIHKSSILALVKVS